MKGLKMKPHLGKIKSDVWGEILFKKQKKETYVGHNLGCGLTHGLSVLFHLSKILFLSIAFYLYIYLTLKTIVC